VDNFPSFLQFTYFDYTRCRSAGMPWWIVLTKLACGKGLRWLLEMETNGIAPKRE